MSPLNPYQNVSFINDIVNRGGPLHRNIKSYFVFHGIRLRYSPIHWITLVLACCCGPFLNNDIEMFWVSISSSYIRYYFSRQTPFSTKQSVSTFGFKVRPPRILKFNEQTRSSTTTTDFGNSHENRNNAAYCSINGPAMLFHMSVFLSHILLQSRGPEVQDKSWISRPIGTDCAKEGYGESLGFALKPIR